MVAGLIAASVLLSTQSQDRYLTLVNFTTGGFYIGFGLPVFAALAARMSGRFEAGPWNLGRWGYPVTVGAAVWVAFELINIAWPRATDLPWYQEYGVIVMIVVIGALGVLAYLPARSRIVAEESRLRVARGSSATPRRPWRSGSAVSPPTGLMEEMTWPEVKAAADAGLPVVLPVGSTEQHGPHLPLNTTASSRSGSRCAPPASCRWWSRRRSASAPGHDP